MYQPKVVIVGNDIRKELSEYLNTAVAFDPRFSGIVAQFDTKFHDWETAITAARTGPDLMIMWSHLFEFGAAAIFGGLWVPHIVMHAESSEVTGRMVDYKKHFGSDFFIYRQTDEAGHPLPPESKYSGLTDHIYKHLRREGRIDELID
ncbi:MAG: hypothetical protein ABH879_02575 [archaeon]